MKQTALLRSPRNTKILTETLSKSLKSFLGNSKARKASRNFKRTFKLQNYFNDEKAFKITLQSSPNEKREKKCQRGANFSASLAPELTEAKIPLPDQFT